MAELVGDRIRTIREDLKELQTEFAARLTAKAKQLKIEARYDPSSVSKMERAWRSITLDDVLVVAEVDPKKRGRDWLAWGDSPIGKPGPAPRGALIPDPDAIEATSTKKRRA